MSSVDSFSKNKRLWVYPFLALILILGAYFRFSGLDWDEGHHPHPDERFLTGVETSLIPVNNLGEYFNTDNSTLNPHNRGSGLFVYGTMPIFLVRYLGDLLHQAGIWMSQFDLSEGSEFSQSIAVFSRQLLDMNSYNGFKMTGRYWSSLADLFVVVLVYQVAARVYDKRVGVLAAAFSAFSVLQIQLSHYFTVDTSITLFTFLSIYFAVLIATEKPKHKPELTDKDSNAPPSRFKSAFNMRLFIWFGVALGLAAASKINAAPVALMLPLAVLLRISDMSKEERRQEVTNVFSYLTLAALVSLLVFRIFQPYAFSGPGFFGMSFNDKWVANIQEVIRLAGADWPPSLQWARRPIWFSFENIVLWGLGLPLAIAAWGGFVWLGWRILKGKWRKHILLWIWTAAYFTWQSSLFNPTMRYQLPIYPTLVIFAAWAIIALWDLVSAQKKLVGTAKNVLQTIVLVIGSASLLGTFLWALAFSNIYTQTEPRLEASRWIYANLPGPLTLHIETDDGVFNQPLPFIYNQDFSSNDPYFTSFTAMANGTLSEIQVKHILAPSNLAFYDAQNLAGPIASASEVFDYSEQTQEPFQGISINLPDSNPLPFEEDYPVFAPETEYLVQFALPPGEGSLLLQDVSLSLVPSEEQPNVILPLLELDSETLEAGSVFQALINFPVPTEVKGITIIYSIIEPLQPAAQTINLILASTPDLSQVLATSSEIIDISNDLFAYSDEQYLTFDQPIGLIEGMIYYMELSLEDEAGSVKLLGAAAAIETGWDMGLPFPEGGYDGYGGLYQPGINLDIYADDNQTKLDRFLSSLDISEYLLISSSRQWASTTRIPERFPLTSAYYRHLLGCPQSETIEWCYNVAQIGTFEGNLGFEIVQIFQNNPSIGSFEINDQFSEEAFTVYDHPKVFIFQKTEAYDSEVVSSLLSAVDLSNVQILSPMQVSGGLPPSLQLSADEVASQQAGGTWSELFNVDNLVNSSQPVAVLVWYLGVLGLGIVVYPLVRLALPGLADRGYPLSRTVGLLILSYLSWIGGSAGLPFSRLTIGIILIIIAIAGGFTAYRQREELRAEWVSRRSYFLKIEVLFLTFFLLGLLIRFGNPDLWHPAKGGEKPMDLSYLTAIIKSSSFPPYDPWFAGGYINYYYYGFVFVGSLVKFLGINPTVAYNLILPTLLSMVGMGAFTMGWNIYVHRREKTEVDEESPAPHTSPWLVGGAAALGMAILGNLGTLRMVFRGYQRLGALGGFVEESAMFTKWVWAFRGFFESLKGASLESVYGIGDWYWNPSRVIPPPSEPITEFPIFTFLYADLHAHLMALPLTLLAASWALSVVFGKAWKQKRTPLRIGWSLLLGGLAIGSLWPTNTWDYPTYLVLGIVALGYSIWQYYHPKESRLQAKLTTNGLRIVAIIISGGLLIAFSRLLYSPYYQAYAQGYSSASAWTGPLTPSGSYFTHWGLFLFVLVTWLAWETYQWMATTPLSSLRKLIPFKGPIIGAFSVLFIMVVYLQLSRDVFTTWISLPLAAWSGVLLLRPNLSDGKRIVLFLMGTGFFLTLLVELVVIAGDVGRMNTVFKFYMQVWTLFAVSSAVALGWILSEIRYWKPSKRTVWQLALAALVGAAALFPIFATVSKIKDRMSLEAPNSLDGMAFMEYASYATHDINLGYAVIMDLSQDYAAIQWMQDNVEGSPVIVEANNPQYFWGTRFTIYTGLPSVVGWEWHQIQQRSFVPGNPVIERVAQVREFYETEDQAQAQVFLQTYGVKYIIVGQLERATYLTAGMEKFEALNGELWQEVYRDQETVIYEVLANTQELD